MVRLVFRPYTQVWRTICTSVSLRASTRVSPGFTLLKHSSPSFGSYQICSYSNLSQKIMVGRCCGPFREKAWHLVLTFIKPMSFCTRKLAYVIDSLVRVSRRVGRSRCSRNGPRYWFINRELPAYWIQYRRHKTALCLWNHHKVPLHRNSLANDVPRPLRVGALDNLLHRQGIHFYRFLLNDFKSFNPLFKVLFTFPSQYLFAIGFP